MTNNTTNGCAYNHHSAKDPELFVLAWMKRSLGLPLQINETASLLGMERCRVGKIERCAYKKIRAAYEAWLTSTARSKGHECPETETANSSRSDESPTPANHLKTGPSRSGKSPRG